MFLVKTVSKHPFILWLILCAFFGFSPGIFSSDQSLSYIAVALFFINSGLYMYRSPEYRSLLWAFATLPALVFGIPDLLFGNDPGMKLNMATEIYSVLAFALIVVSLSIAKKGKDYYHTAIFAFAVSTFLFTLLFWPILSATFKDGREAEFAANVYAEIVGVMAAVFIYEKAAKIGILKDDEGEQSTLMNTNND